MSPNKCNGPSPNAAAGPNGQEKEDEEETQGSIALLVLTLKHLHVTLANPSASRVGMYKPLTPWRPCCKR